MSNKVSCSDRQEFDCGKKREVVFCAYSTVLGKEGMGYLPFVTLLHGEPMPAIRTVLTEKHNLHPA